MRNLKKTLALILVAVFCLSLCPAAFAAEAESTAVVQEASTTGTDSSAGIQPRAILGYINHYHSGGNYGEFKVPTDSSLFPAKKFSIQTSGFDSNTLIVVQVYNSRGQLTNKDGGWVELTGSTSVNDTKMTNFIKGDTYTVKYNVYNASDDGWIGIWIF